MLVKSRENKRKDVKVKILLINHFPLQGSGSGVYAANIAKSLEKKGHKTCIITPENTSVFSNLKGIKLHPVFFKHEEKIEGQQEFNFPCFDPHPRSSLLFCDMTSVQLEQYKQAFRKAIEEEILEFKPDVIHAQHIWLISSIALEYNIPVVITSHGSDIMGYDDWPQFHDVMYKVADGCKKIVAISNHSKEIIENIFVSNKEKIVTIPNGYDKKCFYKENYNKNEILAELEIDKEYDKIVCFAGRLAKNKGVDLLLQAAKRYENENVLTLISGYGEEYNNLIKMRDEFKLKNVVFLGNRSHDILRKIYNISDVCVVPSRKEAFGLVALEAIACGTPVIATKQGGMTDFVSKEVGILIEKENIEELEEAILQILNGKAKFDSKYLAQYAKNNYKQDLFIDKLIDIYKEIIN
mgnify:CR=1 FL=1